MGTGEGFVKKIGYVGCAIFLGIFVLFLVTCFTTKPPVEGYKAPNSSEYYAAHLDELKAELEDHLFPKLDGVTDCTVSDGVLCITLAAESFEETAEAITHYYAKELFSFLKEGET